MKFSHAFLFILVLALLINITACAGTEKEPLRSFRFWLDMLLTTGAFVGYALWISYARVHFLAERKAKQERLIGRHTAVYYFLFALAPVYVMHLAMVAAVGESLDHVKDRVLHDLLYYMPTIVVLTFLYAFTLWRKQKFGLLYIPHGSIDSDSGIGKQKLDEVVSEVGRRGFKQVKAVVLPPLLNTDAEEFPNVQDLLAKREEKHDEPFGSRIAQGSNAEETDKTHRSRFDDESYPQNLYYFLIEKGGIQGAMQGAAPRFLDIVFIHSASRWRYVILRDGERLQADAVFNQLKQRGIDKWMLKISANVYVNMLLVIYPLKKNATRLELQPDVVASLLEKHSLADQKKMLRIGRGMPKNIIERFLITVKTMDHNGWNDFIPLS
ncbi:hypothetical protein [Sphingobacterium paludis]|uniref:Uncharacterized protein n=1 Tax=Sphingobacterium paludis TaxID=1476465 RepID=A0A4R7CYW2_9SPHI|nr:hypothetical protein [Sphingobacterium paludis]TDS12335.1 hypothetical protein B0I21_106193 [Sphingobacterium paludis]